MGSHGSYVPFPDLTGWRSSAPIRRSSSSSRHVSVTLDSNVTGKRLEEAAQRLGRSRAENLIAAAWAIVLIHLLSQEGGIIARFILYPNQLVHITCSEEEKKELSVASILDSIEGAREMVETEDVDQADNTVHLLSNGETSANESFPSTVILSAGFIEASSRVRLRLQASPTVHSSSSARTHLEQVAACLEFLCSASAFSPALSLHYFADELLAGDNAHPKSSLDDMGEHGLCQERFEHQLERVTLQTPTAIALDFRADYTAGPGDESVGNILWTYEELGRRADIICSEIQARTPGSRNGGMCTPIVALCLEKTPFTYVSILAVLKARAAWCPIDTDWPQDRQRALLAKSGARLVLTAGDNVSAALQEVIPNEMEFVRLDRLDYTQAQITLPHRESSPEDSSDALAYLIWTSGTTGLPKAVGIQHKAAVQALRSLQKVIPHQGSYFRYLQFSAYNFDLMIMDVFYTWGLGGVLCSSSRSTLLTNLIPLSNTMEVTHTLLTPAVMAMTPRHLIPSLQVVINGGEKLSQVVADTWSVDCCLLNLYGPAEATLIAMHRRVPDGDQVKAPNIGRALPTTSCHAVDAKGDIVLKGAVGQLVIGGHQCAIGYVGEDDKSRDKFVEHAQLGRVYKTGDVVRQLWNGDFEYLGRSDDQIKVNGIRIELLEINSTIRSASEKVKDSETLVIQGFSNGNGDAEDVQIVNFSVSPAPYSGRSASIIRQDEDAVELAKQLIKTAKRSLPLYMIPSLFLILTHFPRTSSAKIDREALRKEVAIFNRVAWLQRLSSKMASESTEGEEGNFPMEETIRRNLAALCGLAPDQVGRHTSLPSLGLNSIKAIKLSRVLKEEGIDVSVIDIVKYSTLAELANKIHISPNRSSEREVRVSAALTAFDNSLRSAVEQHLRDKPSLSAVQKILPTTPLQEALLSETLREPSSYWLHRIYSLPPSIDTSRLSSAIRAVVQEIEILRTCFLSPAQLSIDNAHGKTTFIQVVLSQISTAIAETKLQRFTKELDAVAHLKTFVGSHFKLQAVSDRPPVAFVVVDGEQPCLFVVLHHAVYDQMSLRLLEGSIVKHYHNGKGGGTSLAPFSAALKHFIACNAEEEERRHQTWARLLSSYPKGHIAKFPDLSGRSREVKKLGLSTYHHKTSLNWKRLSKAAQDLQVSVRPFLQVAWASIICAYCDTGTIVIGDSVSARTTSTELRRVVGPVLDTLPVPIDVKLSYRNAVSAVDSFNRQAISSHPVPLRHIRKMIALPNDFPLFTNMFVFNAPEEEAEIEVIEDDFLHKKKDYDLSVEHDLAAEVSFTSDGQLTLDLVAQDATFSPQSARLLLRQWESAIMQAVNDPDSKADDFPASHFADELLSISRLVETRSLQTAGGTPVHASLERWAKETPDALAIDFWPALDSSETRFCKTYAELNRESSAAGFLLHHFAPTGSVVAVSLHRSVETYIILLAILRSGKTYLPIDPSLPENRKVELLKSSRAACMVCSSTTEFTAFGHSCATLRIDSTSYRERSAEHQINSPPMPEVDMSSPAYILFTSGSTGEPKGCVLSHKNLQTAIEAFRLKYEEYAPGSLDRTTRFFARSIEAFDVALLETLLPLQVGGTIVTGPREVILQDVGKAMKTMQVTHAAVVPSLFYTEGRRVVPSDLPHLRVLIVGGERIAADIIDLWGSSHVPLLNAYGPTEACIGTSIGLLEANDSTGNIGPPFPGTQYLVLKECEQGLRLALRGEAGELCIAGLQIGNYLKLSDPDPFFIWRGKRIYRTGDEVRIDGSDSTEYLGRIIRQGQTSRQVKIRGVRIELNEIDAVLSKSTKSVHFVATLMTGEPPYLVTFVASTATSISADEELKVAKDLITQGEAQSVRKYAKAKLPSYMLPRVIIWLQKMPLSLISGKVDVKRLDQWYQAQSPYLLALDSRTKEKGPGRRQLTDREIVVSEEIQRLLQNKSSIAPTTDVFALGLDSLNVITLTMALRRRGFDLDAGRIMAHPTVEEIALLDAQPSQNAYVYLTDHTEAAQRARAGALNILSAYPLLPLQESMITQTLIDKGSRYINQVRLECADVTMSRARLEGSIFAALDRHDIYKTVFFELDGRMVQAVADFDVTMLKYDESEFVHAGKDIIAQMGKIPPLRFAVTEANQLLIAIHHALYDGHSFGALLQEIEDGYRGNLASDGQPPQFAAYVTETSHCDVETKLDNWQRLLSKYSVTPFPCVTGRRPTADEEEQQQPRFMVEIQSTAKLTALRARARQEKVTMQLLAAYAFALLYSQYVGEDHVVFGLVLGGRTGSVREVHGPCINTVPFPVHLKSGCWQTTLQKTYGKALQNQHIPLPALSRRMQVDGSLFNTLFSYMGSEKQNSLFRDVSSEMKTEYPVAVEVQEQEHSDGVALRIVFDPDLIPQEQAILLLEQLDSLLCFDIALREDKALIFAAENSTPYEPVIEDSFIARFKSQARNRPTSVAFVFSHDFDLPEDRITYAEVDSLSDKIASGLAEIEGTVVGVLMRQCPHLYALLVAIWKVGKVYTPLDPSLPLERLEYMVSVAQPAILVASTNDLGLAKKLGQALSVEDLILEPKRILEKRFHLPVHLDKSAYIMFTSGSSGKPKGVQISHRALAAAIYSWSQILPYSHHSRLLQLASPGFDVFLIEVCMPLALGFSFASAPKEVLLTDLEASFRKLELTMADLPAVLAPMVRPDHIEESGKKLEWLMSGGDQIDDRVITQWSARGLINAWGPTETTIGNTLGFVNEHSSRSWVGKPYPATSIYILDPATLQVIFRGCIGEIAVGGPQLADGYVANREMTKDRFIALSDGTRIYRTGDRGRLLWDGSLECLGRIDAGQVKVNSQRVELREIEWQLCRHEAVQDACVLYLNHPEMQSRQLVAFALINGKGEEGDDIRFMQDYDAKSLLLSSLQQAGQHLASYMMPAFTLVLDRKHLPLTPNNKVDTRRLAKAYDSLTARQVRELDARSGQYQQRTEDSWSKVEGKLKAIISDFCGIPEVEVRKEVSFYRVGIDSISAFRLLGKLRQQEEFSSLSVRDILKAPSISALASRIENMAKQGGADEEIIVEDGRLLRQGRKAWQLSGDDQIELVLPCTPLQEGLLLESLATGLYVHCHLFVVQEENAEVADASIVRLAEHCSILRTSFHLAGGRFVQAVHSSNCIQIVSLPATTSLKDAATQVRQRTTIKDESDLAKPPVKVRRIPVGRQVLYGIELHHALYDGECLAMLFLEMEKLAQGLATPARTSFAHILPYMLSRRQDERFIADQVGSCPSSLVSHHSSSTARTCLTSRCTMTTKMDTLSQAAANAGVTVRILALHVFSKLLAHMTKQKDLVFGQLFSLRDVCTGAEDVIGPALNSVLTRVTIRGNVAEIDALRILQGESDATQEHRRASMAGVLRLVRERREGNSFNFDSLFDFQRGGKSEVLSLSDKAIFNTLPENQEEDEETQYAFNVQFRQQGEDLTVVAIGDSDTFSHIELDGHLQTLDQLLQLVVSDPHQTSTCMPEGIPDLQSPPVPVPAIVPSRNDQKSQTEGAQRLNCSHHAAPSSARTQTYEEQMVLAVVAELSQAESKSIDVDTAISQFGLDSILAIKMATILRHRGATVGVADILLGKTVRGIGERIALKGRKESEQLRPLSNDPSPEAVEVAEALGVQVRNIDRVLPTLPGQEYELSEYVSSGGSNGIFPFTYQIRNPSLDVSRLERAWYALVKQHSGLRTAFVALQGGSVRQVILSAGLTNSWQVRRLETSFSSLFLSNSSLQLWLSEVCPIDQSLSRPPCAACLVDAVDGPYLIIRLHHALYDAQAIVNITRDLWQLYSDSDAKRVEISSTDHIKLTEDVAGERMGHLTEARQYWSSLLTEGSSCFVGRAGPSPSTATVATITTTDFFKHASTIEQKLRLHKVSLASAFVAGWSQVLLRWCQSRSEKIVFGLYRRGRSSSLEGIEDTVANCMTVLPVVIEKRDVESGLGLCHKIRAQLDEQSRWEASTSILDLLRWESHNLIAPWNTYLNLLWDDQRDEEAPTEGSGNMFQWLDVSIPPADEKETRSSTDVVQAWRGAQLGNMRSEVSVNARWNRESDSISVGVRYRSDILTEKEAIEALGDLQHFVAQMAEL